MVFRQTARRMTNFNIEIVSDTVCPWCYIGKKKLDKAIASYKELHPESQDTFSISWLPFYLNPGAPKTGSCFFHHFWYRFLLTHGYRY